jgi:hypothetical protein
MKLHGLVPDSYIHVSVSDLYIPRVSLPIWLQQNRWTDHCIWTPKKEKKVSTGVSHDANLLDIYFRYIPHFNALLLKKNRAPSSQIRIFLHDREKHKPMYLLTICRGNFFIPRQLSSERKVSKLWYTAKQRTFDITGTGSRDRI